MSGITYKNRKMGTHRVGKYYRSNLLRHTILAGGVALLAYAPNPASALTTKVGDFTITLQSTLGYNTGVRTAPVNSAIAGLNSNDGDLNFRSGAIGNRFQTLEQLNIQNGNYGLRASGLAYIDTMYLHNNKNNSPSTFNSYGVGPQGFPSETVANEGRRVEPLAIFVYGSEYFDNGSNKFAWQIGRQTITWGEALFTTNGLAGLQAPLDFYQAQLLPNPQAQALFLPTGAAQFSYTFANSLAFNAYWQFEYEPDILPGVGSYFSSSDIVGPGAQRFLATPNNVLGGLSVYRAPDIRPANGLDQFGFDAHYTLDNTYGLGAYFVQGIPKTPNVYFGPGVPIVAHGGPGPAVGTYTIAYAKPVDALAVSLTTLVGAANVAMEMDDFLNQPLISGPGYSAANLPSYSHPLYAEGNVFNAVINEIYLTPPLLGPVFANGITTTGELTYSNVVSVNKNKSVLIANNTSYGAGLELTLTPSWFPISDVQIQTPIGWSTTYLGNSPYTGVNAGTSTYDIGVKAIYKTNLTAGINYQRYAGPVNRQSHLDRDFASLYIQYTF